MVVWKRACIISKACLCFCALAPLLTHLPQSTVTPSAHSRLSLPATTRVSCGLTVGWENLTLGWGFWAPSWWPWLLDSEPGLCDWQPPWTVPRPQPKCGWISPHGFYYDCRKHLKTTTRERTLKKQGLFLTGPRGTVRSR